MWYYILSGSLLLVCVKKHLCDHDKWPWQGRIQEASSHHKMFLSPVHCAINCSQFTSIVKIFQFTIAGSGVATDFRVGSWGHRVRGSRSWPEKLPTQNNVFLLDFRPLYFVDIKITQFFINIWGKKRKKLEISGRVEPPGYKKCGGQDTPDPPPRRWRPCMQVYLI